MSDIGAFILQFSIALGILIGVLLLVYFFVMKRFPRAFGGKHIAILERRYIDRFSSIVLVRIMDEYYFILVTQSGGTVLKKLKAEEISEEDFSSVFFKKLGRKEKGE